MDRAVSILSGGMDSAVSTAIARDHHDVHLAITFDYGQKAAVPEIKAAKNFCSQFNIKHRVIKFDLLSEIGKSALTSKSKQLPHLTIEELENDPLAKVASAEQVWVPNRNGIFINIVAAIAEVEGMQWMLTGFNREEAETFPDNSSRYIDQINSCLAESTLAQPQVISYVKEMDKTEILKAASEKGVDISKLWCCYDGGKQWCGKCESCTRTIRAMKHLNVYEKYADKFESGVNG